jgi:hypothetical protein
VLSVGDLHRSVSAANGTLALKVLRGAEARELEVSLDTEPS